MPTTKASGVAVSRWWLALALASFGCGSSSSGGGGAGAGAIGPDGGTFDGGGGITVVVPQGALSQPVKLTVAMSNAAAPPVPGFAALSYPYKFGPDGTVFGAQGATVTLPLPPGAPANSTILTTKLGDPLTYEDAHGTVSGGSISAQVGHLSSFVVAVPGMNTARFLHAATLLKDGRVLIAGGTTFDPAAGEVATGSAELYDPGTKIFTSAGSMTTVRSLETATLLPDGKVLIAGGGTKMNAGAGLVPTLASAELYDPATGTFTVTGSMRTARQGHTATLLPVGRVLVVGGDNDACLTVNTPCQLASAELYDPATGTFGPTTSSMSKGRVGHTATLLNNGTVMVVGGALGNPELYDPETGSFTTAGPLVVAPKGHTATLLPDGRALIAGGQDLNALDPTTVGVLSSSFLYDPASGTFTATASMAQARNLHTATLLPGGKVLIAGGAHFIAGPPATILGSWELYDPLAGIFSEGQMATARTEHTATLLPDGQVLIAGGIGQGEVFIPGGIQSGTLPLASVELR